MTIREMYEKHIIFINYATNAMNAFRRQDYETGIQNMRWLIRDLPEAFQLCINNQELFNSDKELVSQEDIISRLTAITEAFEARDYVLLADYIEILLLPLLVELQGEIRKTGDYISSKLANNLNALKGINGLLASEIARVEVDIYDVEDTSCGLFTISLQDERGNYYLHSNVNPIAEAKQMARRYEDDENFQYIVYGMGLGYLPEAIAAECEGNRVIVYDGDLKMIKTALTMRDYSALIATRQMEIIYDPRYQKLKRQLKSMDESTFVIHSPSLRNIKNTSTREALLGYFTNASGMLRVKDLLNHNFNQNQKTVKESVWECENNIKGKRVIIVAAGPSLDKNVDLLKDKPKDTVILTTSTAYQKLLGLGIEVDYIIHTDAQKKTAYHFRNSFNQQTPLLFLSTAAPYIARQYAGPKYLIYQEGFDKAEKMAKEKGENVFETGGSVATTALDVAVQLGAKDCVFVGLDLAYTNYYAHASNTSDMTVDKSGDFIMVSGVNEEQVPTNGIFLSYIKWFEEYLKRHKEITVYDATEGGAKIQGMTITTLDQIKKS